MTGKQFQSDYFTFREGNLPGPARADYSQHLANCSECREFEAGWDAILSVVEADRSAEPNPFTATRILRRVDDEFGPGAVHASNPAGWLKPVLVAAALACGIFIGTRNAGLPGPGTGSGPVSDIESLKSSLFIPEIADEDKVLVLNR